MPVLLARLDEDVTIMRLSHTLPGPLKIRTDAFGATSTPLDRVARLARSAYAGTVPPRVVLHAVVLGMAVIVVVAVAH